MTLHDLLIVYAAYGIAAGSPGPSNMAIMNTAMRHGRRAGLALAAGVITMSATWGTVAATGLSALLASTAAILVVLKIGGGLYLLWLAYRAARSAVRPGEAAAGGAETAAPDLGALYRRGVLMHAGNPKAVLGWAAIMTLGLQDGARPGVVAAALGGCILLGILIFTAYALLFSTRPMVRAYARARRWIEGTLAVFFAGAGLRMLLSR